MKRIYDTEKGCMMAIDGEYEFELGFCYNQIASWKKSYMRKNSKKRSSVILRCYYSAPEPDFWKYFLELHIEQEIITQTRISKEAYDILGRDKQKEDYSGIEFVTYLKFVPSAFSQNGPIRF